MTIPDLFKTTQQQELDKKNLIVSEELRRDLGRLVGKNLATARNILGFSQTKVMEDVFNLTDQKNRISEIENGKMPDIYLLQRLCIYYGVSSDWVLGFTAEPDLDRNASRVGMLYTGLFESFLPVMKEITMNFAQMGAHFIAESPKTEVMKIVESAKKLINKQTEEGQISEELAGLMHAVRECEVLLSRQQCALYKNLDDISQNSHVLYADVVARHQAKHSKSVVSTKFIRDCNLSLF